MGAAVAQQFALDHPDNTGALVLLSAFERAEGGFRSKLMELRNSLVDGGVPAFFDEAVKLVTEQLNRDTLKAVGQNGRIVLVAPGTGALINIAGGDQAQTTSTNRP